MAETIKRSRRTSSSTMPPACMGSPEHYATNHGDGVLEKAPPSVDGRGILVVTPQGCDVDACRRWNEEDKKKQKEGEKPTAEQPKTLVVLNRLEPEATPVFDSVIIQKIDDSLQNMTKSDPPLRIQRRSSQTTKRPWQTGAMPLRRGSACGRRHNCEKTTKAVSSRSCSMPGIIRLNLLESAISTTSCLCT